MSTVREMTAVTHREKVTYAIEDLAHAASTRQLPRDQFGGSRGLWV